MSHLFPDFLQLLLVLVNQLVSTRLDVFQLPVEQSDLRPGAMTAVVV